LVVVAKISYGRRLDYKSQINVVSRRIKPKETTGEKEPIEEQCRKGKKSILYVHRMEVCHLLAMVRFDACNLVLGDGLAAKEVLAAELLSASLGKERFGLGPVA
jgi:hypothetical protein